MRSEDDERRCIPMILVSEGSLIYTSSNPFCYSDSCGCHEDPELIAEVAHAVDKGLLTTDEAKLTIAGKTV